MSSIGRPEEKIIPNPTDALEFKPVKRSRSGRAGLRYFFVLLFLCGMAGVGWFFYGDHLRQHVGDQLPVIRAMEGPVKVRPKTPGGMSIPDRDKLVYERMNGGDAEPRVERLLPLPEVPKIPPVPTHNLSSTQKLNPGPLITHSLSEKSNLLPKQDLKKPLGLENKAVVPDTSLKGNREPALKQESIQVPSASEKVPVSSTQPKQGLNTGKVERKNVVNTVNTPMTIPNSISPPKINQKPSTNSKKVISSQAASSLVVPFSSNTPISGIAYQVQIAAVRTREMATSEWTRLKNLHGDLLGDYSLNVVRVDLGPSKGIFYRLRAGPISWEDVAKSLCENLIKRKVGCLIVRPGG